MRVVRAHLDLARAEADEIKGEVARAAGLGGGAIALLVLLALLLPIGLIMFMGEWIFGSMGWGVLLGSELLIALAVALVLAALRVSHLWVDLLLAVVIAVIVSVVLGPNLSNELWRRIGDAASLGEPAWRPLATGIIVVGVVGALLGLLRGAISGGVGGAVAGLVAGLIVGVLLGALLSITYGWRAGVAVGVAVGFVAWPVLMGMRVARQGIDGDALKARFMPQTTIDTTKETIEWVKAKKARVPFVPRS
jgi:hypothetical protein